MKLRELHLEKHAPIPGYSEIAGSPSTQAKDFHVDDGWEVLEILPGVFSVLHSSMSEPVVLGGYAYSFTRLREPRGFEGVTIETANGPVPVISDPMHHTPAWGPIATIHEAVRESMRESEAVAQAAVDALEKAGLDLSTSKAQAKRKGKR